MNEPIQTWPGDDPYAHQLPLSRAIPLWGGISEGGFAEVVLHPREKLKVSEWVEYVREGKLTAAIKSLEPMDKKGPWHVMCDNEPCLKRPACYNAYKEKKIKLWLVPPRSPDLNMIEKFWSWLGKELRRRDLKDLREGRPVLGKIAYRLRVKAVLRSPKSQQVASRCAGALKKVCKAVVAKKGAHSGFK